MKNLLISALLITFSLHAQTISEKKISFAHEGLIDLDADRLEALQAVNDTLAEKKEQLCTLYGGKLNRFTEQQQIAKIEELRREIADIEEMWRKEATSSDLLDAHALWHQPESNILQLIIDYGASDYLYVVPPEIGLIHCSLSSNLPIPKESWSDCLELILSQYGIGIKSHSAFLRELYFLHSDLSAIELITDREEQLQLLAPRARVCFVLAPADPDPRGTLLLLQKFSNLATTDIQAIGGKLYITGLVADIQELLKLYTFAKAGSCHQDFHIAKLSKLDANEMQRVLNHAFHGGQESQEGSSLRLFPIEGMSHTLFLSGGKNEIKKAVELIQNIENQIEDPKEKTVFWYTARHSDAEELASILERVYGLLCQGTFDGTLPEKKEVDKPAPKDEKLPVPTKFVGPATRQKEKKGASDRHNFIVDSKTGAIIMVVETNMLPKIKELLKKLDVPKRMVQLEVLLFEKKLTNQNRTGLNLLRLGDQAADQAKRALSFAADKGGILDFFISRNRDKNGVPAFDMAYQFLLSQEDVQINASPSITTMNQTPASFAIVEEISIDSGANDKNGRVYNRAQYGIVIEVTPTINMEEGEEGFITLDTDISFDTTKRSKDERPDVTRRHIKNRVRIANGETLILGGLRQKNSQDNKESIPFLGEIPGLGKLFGTQEMSDTSTEMFLFITPRILQDPGALSEQTLIENLSRRPGDMPELVHELLEAKGREKKRLFEGSLTALFGRGSVEKKNERRPNAEYDGR